MADSAALLVDEILPHQPMRQWSIENIKAILPEIYIY